MRFARHSLAAAAGVAVVLSTCRDGDASTTDAAPGGAHVPWPIVLGGVLALAAAAFVVSRAMTRASSARERAVSSFAGGVSLAFVMLELFVELVDGSAGELHDIVRAGPEPVHTIAILLLLGAVATLVASRYTARHEENWRSYLVAFAPQVLYAGLVGAALVEEAHVGPRAFAVFWFAMVMHLGVADHRFATRFPREHKGLAPGASVASLVAGAVTWAITAPPAGLFYALLALVAGTTLLQIAREEIPSSKDVRLGAFFAGLLAFGLLIQLRWWL